MKKLGTFLFLSILFLFTITTANIAQVSPDYIFGGDNGSLWDFATGTAGTAGLGSTYKWQFLSTATTDQSIEFGETSSSVDGSGFWQNNAGVSAPYIGAGAMQAAYYNVNTVGLGPFYWAITTGNYYVVKVVKQSGSDAYFAVFDNGAQAPRTITAMGKSYNDPDLWVFVSLSGAKSANEKVWVRYTTDNWATSSTVEADLDMAPPGLTNWQAEIPLAGGEIVKYYAFTTIQQAAAPAEAYADLFAVNYNNNSGINYTYMNGNMTGTYYIGNAGTGPGGSDPHFQFLTQACDALNTSTISGNCTLYITSDLTEPANVGLAVNTNTFTITFKPYLSITPTITYTQLGDNAGTSGAWVIGVTTASGASLVPTHNIVIDGSNTVDGITRDLTFISSSGTNAYPFRIRGNNENITIKNCIMTAGKSTIAYGIWINPVYTNPNNFNPDNITIENCSITATTANAGTPIHVSRSGTTTVAMQNLIIKNNNLIARHRGVFLQGLTNVTTIEGNTFELNQTGTGFLSAAVEGNVIDASGFTYILRNNFKQNSTANTTAGTFGIRTITASGGGTFIIANNFFSGFSAPFIASRTTEVIGIRCGSTVEAYSNTFVMNNIAATTGTLYRGISIAAGTPKIKNNIIITEEDDFVNYCIAGTPGESDYNNFYRTGTTNAKIGLYTGISQATLSDWQIASSKDANSVSKAVNFISATDLHLTGASLGDLDLIGVPIVGITTDIDGETRNVVTPYMGADENLANPLPVELSTFTATANGKNVNLTWKTATEVNSYGFEIERTNSDAQQWEKIAEVNAHGNSNAPVSYSFTDENLNAGKYSYRLKMIDNDGSFTYSPVAEATVEQPNEYVLHQNYPNPFNPVTTIQYSLPVESQVMLQIYNITGELVSTLVNEKQTQGAYNVNFDASGYASGTYIYRLVAGSFVQTKKMLLLK